LHAASLHQFPLYLAAYLHLLLPPFIVGTIFMLAACLVPRRLLLTDDRLTVVCSNHFSFHLRYHEILSVAYVPSRYWLKQRARPLHLLLGEGVLIERQQGRPLVVQLHDAQAFIEALKAAMQGQGQQTQMALFPGMVKDPNASQESS